MKAVKNQKHHREWIAAGLLIVILSALSYLLLAHRFGFYFDDWYLVYAGYVKGASQFIKVFEIDRPFRAFFVGLVFELFGLNAPLYSYLSFVLRIAGAFAMFWMVKLLWPRQDHFAVLLAVMFVLYPGWTDQPAAFDYQSHLLSFAAMMFSLALTVKSILMGRGWKKILLAALAVLLQVMALLLMEYYIGMEGLRLTLIAMLVLRSRSRKLNPNAVLSDGKPIFLSWLPYLLGVLGFLYWRMFLFTSTRAATDIGGMFSGFFNNPAYRGVQMVLNLAFDFFNVTLLAWFVPFYMQFSRLELRESLTGAAIALFAAALVWLVYRKLEPSPSDYSAQPVNQAPDQQRDSLEMLIAGSLGVIFSLLPIALGERHVVFMSFTRFTLPGSVSAILVLGGLLLAFTRKPLRTLLPVLLIFFAVLFHYSNSVFFAESWASMRNFWWQVSWRAPQIQQGTVLAVEYADAAINEDYFVWGPANLIYYPEAYMEEGLVYTPLGATLLTQEAVIGIIQGSPQPMRERRSLLTPQDLGNVLVISMPTAGSCASVMDGNAPELSDRTSHRISRVSPYSKIELVLAEEEPHTPPAALFGSEPEHTFCYYYQKASLARQREDWSEVVRLGEIVLAEDFRPAEWVEWMPFLQGFAYEGRYAAVDRIANLYLGAPFLRDQACNTFREDTHQYGEDFPEEHAYLMKRFCE